MKKIIIGTRGSKLAMTQTGMVRDALQAAWPDLEIEVKEILTSGDWQIGDGEVRLSASEGGKGQFAKEIEQALLAGRVDIAVHSMKDMDSHLPEGLVIEHMLPREDARDALLFRDRSTVSTIADLPAGTVVGTASVRRQAFLLSLNPALEVQPLRGNVGTRIEKVRRGDVDVTLLAMAGLNRLGLAEEADVILSEDVMLPAAGQGAVGIEMRAGDAAIADLLAPLNCQKTLLRVKAERAALAVLDGSCHTPIGAHAVLDGEQMHLRVSVVALDGSVQYGDEERSTVRNVQEAEAFGQRVAQRLKTHVPADLFEQVA